ncbi:hypothetical protein BDZ89DRAFT_1163905 [Hymenopellis radicata]|nr:hypothetical protein BDZ89DRAFT_1163905 [Hymenopellis radicata]
MDIPQHALAHCVNQALCAVQSAAQITLSTPPESSPAGAIALATSAPEVLAILVPLESYFHGGDVVGDSTVFGAFAVGLILSGCIACVIIWRMRRGPRVGRTGRRDEEEQYTHRESMDSLASELGT